MKKEIIETIQSVAQMITGAGAPVTMKADGSGTYLTVQKDTKTILLPVHRAEPVRKACRIDFVDKADFCQYVNANKVEGHTHLFAVSKADKTGMTVYAVMDFHESGAAGVAAWGEHIAMLTLGTSERLMTWIKACGAKLGQVAFAEFIEDNRRVVIDPEPASLVELALKLEGSVDAKFVSKFNTQTGDSKVMYEQDTNTGELVVPKTIALNVPVFETGVVQSVQVNLGFRIEQGKPSFVIRIPGLQTILRDAVDNTRQQISEIVDLPVAFTSAAPTCMPVQEEAKVVVAV